MPDNDRSITRPEAAHMLAKMADFAGKVNHQVDMAKVYAEWAAIPVESQDAVYWVSIHSRLFAWYPDRTFRPESSFTLGEFAVVMQRLRAYWSFGPAPVLQGP